MFQRLGAVVLRRRVLLVTAWAIAAAAAFLLGPPLASVTSSGTTGFLPADSPSRLAAERLAARFPEAAVAASATVVLHRPGGLTTADRAIAAAIADRLRSPDAPAALRERLVSVEGAAVSPQLAPLYRSDDGAVELLEVQLDGDAYGEAVHAAVDALRSQIDAVIAVEADPPEVTVTGTAAIARDYLGSIAQGTDRTTLVTVALVVVILLLIYRAPLAALVPLLTIGAAFAVARGVLGLLAQAGWQIPSLLDAFIVVLVFGVGTDYAIFLLSRLREEQGRRSPARAAVVTVARIGAVITASAGTVVVALLSMAAGSFGMIQTMGPALAIAVAVTLLAGLTLTPALAAMAGRWLTWPRHPSAVRTGVGEGGWDRLGRFVVRRPAIVAGSVLGALAVPLVALPAMNVQFDALAELPAETASRRGFAQVAAHVDRGTLLPLTVLLEAPRGTDLGAPAGLATMLAVADRLATVDGVETVRTLVTPAGGPDVPDGMRPSATLRGMAAQLAEMGGTGTGAGALQALDDPATLAGLEAATRYLDELAIAFPDLAAVPPLASVLEEAHAARDGVRAYQSAGSSAEERQMALLTLLSAAGRLPDDLQAAADVLAGRPDDLFLPSAAAEDPLTAWLLETRLSGDREAARISLVTEADPYDPAAFATVDRVRDTLAALTTEGSGGMVPVAGAWVAGPTAESADVQTVIGEDFRRVGIITVSGILVVLALLLRSLVAPLYLVATVLLSYLTTLGLSTVLFQGILGHQGVDYFIPLIVFVLLVALGSDYNIFLMSRVREESTGADLRAGIAVASARTGTVITSAGVILAGTFLALVAAPLQILVQAGLAVAMGVLIDTFIVRSLLIPALTALIGEAAWWPSVRRGRATPPGGAPDRPASAGRLHGSHERAQG